MGSQRSQSLDSLDTLSELEVGDKRYHYYSLKKAADTLGDKIGYDTAHRTQNIALEVVQHPVVAGLVPQFICRTGARQRFFLLAGCT